MISDADRAYLPPGVSLREAGLLDAVRGEIWPLNETGRFVLERTGRRTLAELAQALDDRFGVGEESARADVRAFAHDLNARLLLNVAPRWGGGAIAWRWLTLAIRLLPTGTLPALPSRRRHVDSTSAYAAFRTVARGLAGHALVAALLAICAIVLLLSGFGAPVTSVPLVLGASLALSLVLHEAGHAIALRDIPCCLGVAGPRAFVLHPPLPPQRRAVVAAAGPAAVLAAGWLAFIPALALTWESVAFGAAFLTAQGLGLTVAAQDGRTICSL